MNRIILKLIIGFNFIGGICLVLMMVLCVLNIILRLFGYPLKGTFELMGFLGAMACSLSLAGTEEKGGHIYVGILFSKLPSKMQKILNIIGWLMSVCLFVLICYKLIALGISIKGFGELSETLNISYYPVIFICAIGVFLAVIVMLGKVVEVFSSK